MSAGAVGRLLLLTPIEPASTGNGLAMRAELFRRAAPVGLEVQTVVVPVAGRLAHSTSADAGTITVAPDPARARTGVKVLAGRAQWRERLGRAGVLPSLARIASPGLGDAVAATRRHRRGDGASRDARLHGAARARAGRASPGGLGDARPRRGRRRVCPGLRRRGRGRRLRAAAGGLRTGVRRARGRIRRRGGDARRAPRRRRRAPAERGCGLGFRAATGGGHDGGLAALRRQPHLRAQRRGGPAARPHDPPARAAPA